MRLRTCWVVAAAALLASGAGIAAAQRGVPTIPRIPTIPVVPVIPHIPAVPTYPQTPDFQRTPDLTPITPAPVVPVDPCRSANPPSYCREASHADGGGEDSCSPVERSCSSTARICLESSGASTYYYVADQNGRPTVFQRTGDNPGWALQSMDSCRSSLNYCLQDKGC